MRMVDITALDFLHVSAVRAYWFLKEQTCKVSLLQWIDAFVSENEGGKPPATLILIQDHRFYIVQERQNMCFFTSAPLAAET